MAYTLLGARLGRLDLSARAARALEGITGVAYLGLAGSLVATPRPA